MLAFTAERRPLITFEVDSFSREELDRWNDKLLNIDVKLFRKSRSRDANAKMWAICREISNEVGLPDVDIYREAIRNVGVVVDYYHLNKEQAESLNDSWSGNGIGWFTEQLDFDADGEHRTMRCYKGSSTYDTAEMARLIDYLVEEANQLGIDVLSDRERSLLLDDWSKKK